MSRHVFPMFGLGSLNSRSDTTNCGKLGRQKIRNSSDHAQSHGDGERFDQRKLKTGAQKRMIETETLNLQ